MIAKTTASFLISSAFDVLGEDLGSGVLETWHDSQMDAKVRLSLDHSLQETDGLYLNYMVVFERDHINYIQTAHQSRKLLEATLSGIGLEFEENQPAL